jgi:hypothetical protein
MMGMMSMPGESQMASKARSQMLQLQGELLQAMGEVLVKYGQVLRGEQ